MMLTAALRYAAPRCLALFLSLAGGAALACGHCVEDRIAAVYDHALVQRTQANGQQLAYFAWHSKAATNEARRLQMVRSVSALPGIVPGSTRVSMQPEALAVAFDPRRSSREAIDATVLAGLRKMDVAIVPLQAATGR